MFSYPCPDCTEETIHKQGCKYEYADRAEIEQGYIDIISWLSLCPMEKSSLKDQLREWTDLHEDCLSHLKSLQRVKRCGDGRLKLLTAEKREQKIVPTFEPLATIYNYGTVPGCHDNGIFALISYYSYQDLSWEETREKLHDWFERTGTWGRRGFQESSIDELLNSKKHVWEEGYGWETKGKAARRVIQNHRRAIGGNVGSSSQTTTA